jgi:tRNA(fMet)-specific endonuclease VapC
MTIAYLVDTDWVVHYLNGRQDIVARLDVLKHQGLGLSTVSLGEPYEETAKIFGRQRGRLRTDGMIIGDSDIWIAATALQYNLTLLPNNRRHFERIEGLRVESA